METEISKDHPFCQMLWQGEEIKKVMRPVKKKFVVSRLFNLIPAAIGYLFLAGIAAFIISAVTSPSEYRGGAYVLTDGIDMSNFALYMSLIFFGLLAIQLLWILLTSNLWYKNRFYCYTNHRIIIQCGIFVRNFRFLQLNQMQSSFVRVGFVDRMLKKNTGSIMFSRFQQSRFISNKGGMGSGLSNCIYFLHIEDPHRVLSEVEQASRAVGGMTGGMGVMMMGNPMMQNNPMGFVGQPQQFPQQPQQPQQPNQPMPPQPVFNQATGQWELPPQPPR